MESLAFTYCAAAYEAPTAPELRSFEELGVNIPSSAWLSLAAVTIVLSVMATKPEPASAALSYGAKGSSVRQLQELLVIKSDGVFGSQTYSRVLRFQRNNGLAADGIVGPQTASALGLSDYNSGYNPVGVGSSGTYTVNAASGLKIHSGPGSSYRVYGRLRNGSRVYLTGRRVYNSGYTWGHTTRGGWIATEYLYQ